MTKSIWNMGKVVVMDSGCCVVDGLIEMRKCGVYGSSILKKRRYWPVGIAGDDIITHFDDKMASHVDCMMRERNGVSFHVWWLKEPEYVMIMMSTYGTPKEVDGASTKQTFMNENSELTTKSFKYTEVFANHFKFRHQVDDHNNRSHSPVSLERTWATKYWPHRCFANFLSLTEVNVNLACGYFIEGSEVLPQVEFRHKLNKDDGE